MAEEPEYIEPLAEDDIAATALTTSRSELLLNRRALIERWPITPEQRSRIIAVAYHIMNTSNKPRTVIGAIKVLVAADSVNAKNNAPEEFHQHQHLHVNSEGKQVSSGTTAREVALENMKNPAFIEFLRSEAEREDREAHERRREENPS